MKKVLSIGLSICMAAALFGCSSGAGRDTAPQTTASAEADTTKAAGEEAENAESASGDTTAAETKAEASIDDYVYDGDGKRLTMSLQKPFLQVLIKSGLQSGIFAGRI